MKNVLLAAACLALAALSAQAAGDKLRLGAFGPGKASGPLLTRAELRDCLDRIDRIRTRNDALTQERERIERDKAELVRQGDELKAQLETLDRANTEAVEAFKARALARDQALDGFEKRTSAFNGEVEGLGAERKTFAQRCENRRFDQDDEAAIRAGK